MKARAHLLFPFDLGLELDFSGPDAGEIFKQVSSRQTGHLSFEGLEGAEATVLTEI